MVGTEGTVPMPPSPSPLHSEGAIPICCPGTSPPALILERSLYWNAFLGYSPVYSYLSCKWVCLDLQAVWGVCLYFLCFPSRHGVVLPNRVALSPASFLHSQESFLCSRTALPLVFVFSSFFSLVISIATAGWVSNVAILQQ